MLGLIGKKIGMTEIFDAQGSAVPVTVIQVEPNLVIGERTVEKNGYSAKVLATGDIKTSRMSKPVIGQFPEKSTPKRTIIEFRDFENECSSGDLLGLQLLADVGFVDICGMSKGKGTQGVMKRWNFGGGRATHGSKFHRENGSTGQSATPSRTVKGVKMSGRMGYERVTVQNLKVIKADVEQGILMVRGAVPGSPDSVLIVSRARKKG